MTQKPSQIVKGLSLIHIILVFASVAIMGTVYLLKNNASEVVSSEKGMNVFELLVPIMAAISILAAHYIGKSRMSKLSKADKLIDKLSVYRANKIILWAALEGSIYFAAVSFYIFGRQNLFLYGLMMVILLVYFRPLRSRVIEDLALNEQEVEQLNA